MTCLLSPGQFFTIPQIVSPYVIDAFFAEADADGEPLEGVLRRSCEVSVVVRGSAALLRSLPAPISRASASPVTVH